MRALMEKRTELTADSMRTDSWSDRLITIGFSSSSLDVPTSTSGLLCLSTICDAKLLTQSAAPSVSRIQSKYGLRAKLP